MSVAKRLGLFAGYGVEMEYMIVDRDTLQVRPMSDQVLQAEAGHLTSDVERGAMAWSNELVLHVLELKTNGPAPALAPLAQMFHSEVVRVNQLLLPFNAMLLPSGTHPFMDPFSETKLWPHEANEIYEAYNRIFNCQGHGWANLQSTHLNLPFQDDGEFGRLHAAIRLLLPLIPALSAASPVLDSAVTGLLDTRLEVYRKNQQKIPLIAGEVVPEPVFSEANYQSQIFQPMFQAISLYDPEGELQEEFLNSRGAIARFSRGAIEIRIIDNQECPLADIAIVTLVSEVLKKLVAQSWSSYEEQQQVQTVGLAAVFIQSLKNGPLTEVADAAYLRHFGLGQEKATVQEIWDYLWQEVQQEQAFTPEISQAVEVLLRQGCLSLRILKFLGPNPSLEKLKAVYKILATCLSENKLFQP
ncbi:glutamate-cysteine ligase family protein [Rufibacter glacialis]|uniref:Glutamate--cysteine ligase n=1 Tax=Rufibacter glacialis TaxID=1259555 RepID=A0A5M8QH22_9BACT|nr:glutamate-cysteine ligase family protein [Rufibacter glacialis]KAA6434230.1 glutamate--cysteine ligase [Rufibacter glacialis]GGK67941.1 glutamate--cysteine ligase [Rufibacter glacialis]